MVQILFLDDKSKALEDAPCLVRIEMFEEASRGVEMFGAFHHDPGASGFLSHSFQMHPITPQELYFPCEESGSRVFRHSAAAPSLRPCWSARVAELADALDSGSSE